MPLPPNTPPIDIAHLSRVVADIVDATPGRGMWGHDVARAAGIPPAHAIEALTAAEQRGWVDFNTHDGWTSPLRARQAAS